MATQSSEQTALETSLKVIKGLSSGSADQHRVETVGIVETHISWVLLTGKIAYKIKKPVNFGFLDFSTLEKRRFFCQEEVRLNRRLAPNLYLDVVPITGTPDQPKLGREGDAIEYAVKMLQFPSGLTLSELALTGKLGNAEVDQITGIIADFHQRVARTSEGSPYGDSENIKHWFDENFDHIRPRLVDRQQLQKLQRIQDWGLREWRSKSVLMQQRRLDGYVRECHGDLHLGNMTMINGTVTLFDCIEFNPMLRWIDVISEAAFLFIDLQHYGYRNLGYRFLNRYLQQAGDYKGLALLRYYLVYRALVRAKVALLRLDQQHKNTAASEQAASEYSHYADLAERFTVAGRTALIITHGYSGSGKSTFAGQLAEKIGALQIRSDIERKRLFGFRENEQSASGIGSGIYTAEAGQRTYRRLAELAKAVIEAGFSVIVDAAFLKAGQRDSFHKLASDCGAQFMIVDFQASDAALRERIRQRRQQYHDASEATDEVLDRQQQTAEPLSAIEREYVITVNTESSDALETLFENFADDSSAPI